jgi:hypothetical protein
MEGTDEQSTPPANGQANPPQQSPPAGSQQSPTAGSQQNPPVGSHQDPPAGGDQQQSPPGKQRKPHTGDQQNPPPPDQNPDIPIPSTEGGEQTNVKKGNWFNNSGSDISAGSGTAKDRDPDNDVYGLPLVSIPAPKATDGDGTVAWTDRWGSSFINRYGKESHGTYRVEKDCVRSYAKPKGEDIKNLENRRGHRKPHQDSKEFTYTRKDIDRILAVAWEGDIELINPASKLQKRFPPTYVYIRWKKNDKYERTWETRTDLGGRYGNKLANNTIDACAQEQEARYSSAKAGINIAESKSPSRGLADSVVREQRQEWEERNRGVRQTTPKTANKNDKLVTEVFEEFKEMTLLAKGYKHYDQHDQEERLDFFSDWRHFRSTRSLT